ncbi:MAG: DUF2147 domain-containing protein [Bacteroidales bacterium]|nr:DUF2147 domain-containing protein [Bacteroidales bacterium]
MKRTAYLIIGLLIVLGVKDIQAQEFPAEAITGVWYNEEKTARIKIYQQDEQFFGKIIWLKEPLDPETGEPKLDKENPEEELRNRPVKGLVMLKNFEYDGDSEYTGGTIYDPKNGKTYKCKMTLESEDQLDVRGYIGYSWMGLGRTTEWTRYKGK